MQKIMIYIGLAVVVFIIVVIGNELTSGYSETEKLLGVIAIILFAIYNKK